MKGLGFQSPFKTVSYHAEGAPDLTTGQFDGRCLEQHQSNTGRTP